MLVSIMGTALSSSCTSIPNSVHPRMIASAPRATRSAIAALNFSLVSGRKVLRASSTYKALCTLSSCSPSATRTHHAINAMCDMYAA